MKDDPLLTAEQLAEYLQEPLSNVYARNHRGTGPRRIRVGREVRYRMSDVDVWLNSRAIEPNDGAA